MKFSGMNSIMNETKNSKNDKDKQHFKTLAFEMFTHPLGMNFINQVENLEVFFTIIAIVGNF